MLVGMIPLSILILILIQTILISGASVSNVNVGTLASLSDVVKNGVVEMAW